MSTCAAAPASARSVDERLRAEAAIEPDPVATSAGRPRRRRSSRSTARAASARASRSPTCRYMMAQQGKRVLLIGCDPKSDTTSLLFGGRACPTIIETTSKKKLAGEEVAIGDVCFKRDGVFAMELGGPEVGRGCGGRGIIHGFETAREARLPRLGLRLRAARFPRRRGLRRLRPADRARHVPEGHRRRLATTCSRSTSPTTSARRSNISASSAAMSASPAWSSTRTTAPARRAAFAEAVGIPVLAAIPANEDIRRKSANYEIIGRPGRPWAPLFEDARRATSPRRRRCARRRSTQDGLLGLFTADAVGRNVVLEPATHRRHVRQDRCRASRRSKSSTTRSERSTHGQPPSIPIDRRARPTPATATAWAATAGKDDDARGAAEAAGKSEMLDRVRRGLSRAGPHDQPQSMCPAFGSLRVGLRMRRTATILSGSACCVYGLTFTSHFYGARRTVGYVPFNSETLVTGKLFEDIREAVYELADPGALRRHRRHQSVRADRSRRAAAAAAEGDQRRAHHRHRRAGLRRADPCRGQGRAGRRDAALCAQRGRAGPGAGAAQRHARRGRR